MGLSHCSECNTIEGIWREPNLAERQANDISAEDAGELEALVCGECGSLGSYRRIPEHDDCDMER